MQRKKGKVQNPKHRVIRRNFGQIRGRLDELVPFLYVAKYGATGRQLRGQRSEMHPGLFTVGTVTCGDHPYVAPRVGIIMPLSLCRNAKTRSALMEIPKLISKQTSPMLADRRAAVQARLDMAFGGQLRIAKTERLNGFFAMEPTSGFFQRLRKEFDYVVELLDDPVGVARLTRSEHFPWQSHGDLMEWYHGLGDCREKPWSPFTPFFVFANTGGLPGYYTERWAQAGLVVPTENPVRWFTIRKEVKDSNVAVRLEMGEYGWAYLHLTLGGSILKIWLSEVFDPFEEFVAWSRKIDEGDIPIQMEIDEEGSEKVLTALRTDDPDRVLLRISEHYGNEIHLEGIISRTGFAACLKQEIRRFFEAEFEPEHWDERDPEDGYVPVKQRVLGNSWFAELK